MRFIRFTDTLGVEREVNVAGVTMIVVIDERRNAIHTLDSGEQGLCRANFQVLRELLARAIEEHLTVQRFSAYNGDGNPRSVFVIVDNVCDTEVRRDGFTHLHFKSGSGCLVDTQLWDSATGTFTTTVSMD